MKLWLMYSCLTLLFTSIFIICVKYVHKQLDNPNDVKIFVYFGFILAGVISLIMLLKDQKKTTQNINNIKNNNVSNKLLLFLLLIVGVLLIVSYAVHTIAMTHCDNPGLPLVIINMNVILVLIISIFLFRSILNWKVIAGIVMALVGISLVLIYNDE